jgi:predicted MPP superfamily phosphohydrolase
MVKNKTYKYYLFGGIIALFILYVILAVQIPAVKMRIVFFGLWFFGEIFLWTRALKSFKNTWKRKILFLTLLILYWLPALIITITMIFLAVRGINHLDKTIYLTVVGVCVIQYLIKFLLFTFVIIYDVLAVFVKLFIKRINIEKGKRRLLRISLGIYAGAFALMMYGMIWGATHFKIREFSLNAPEIKEELKIVLISDLHLAVWRNQTPIEKAVKIINEQQPEFIFITGDFVQFSADEFTKYMSVLERLQAKYGIYSVLGNHDYGRYARFQNDSLRKEDVYKLILYQTLLGWKVLNNESVRLYHDSIPLGVTIAGVEYFSPKKMFINEGNITKTFADVNPDDYVIFLSHDPQAWDEVIRSDLPANLTLSGHTHGMQVGIYTNKLRFSPASILYRKWGGFYEKQGKFLYVNVGLGSVGFPARVGMPPEITVINLY